MENFKELFDKMLTWVEDDFNKGLFVDAYNKISTGKNQLNTVEPDLPPANVICREFYEYLRKEDMLIPQIDEESFEYIFENFKAQSP